MHILLLGIVLGMGAAIPIGPVNLQIIRRHLHFGSAYGIAIGLGACTTDLVFLALLCTGALTLLQYPLFLRTIGIIGSLVLAWFAYKSFCAKPSTVADKKIQPSLLKFFIEGFVITALNPYTVLFWSSVSSQISLLALSGQDALWLAGGGVIIGTVSWVLILNTILHYTRHRLTDTAMRLLNRLGGVILLGFAGYGLYRVLISL